MLYFINVDMWKFAWLFFMIKPRKMHFLHTTMPILMTIYLHTFFKAGISERLDRASSLSNERFSNVGWTIIQPPDRANILEFHILHVRLILKEHCYIPHICDVKYAKNKTNRRTSNFQRAIIKSMDPVTKITTRS